MSQYGLPLGYIYPWYSAFEQNLTALKALQTSAPANLKPALTAAIVAGDTIETALDQGHSVSSTDAKNWLWTVAKLAQRFPAQQGAPIVQASNAGQQTPDDSIVQPVAPGGAIYNAVAAALQGAHDEVAKLLPNIPWVPIVFGFAVLLTLPILFPPERSHR